EPAGYRTGAPTRNGYGAAFRGNGGACAKCARTGTPPSVSAARGSGQACCDTAARIDRPQSPNHRSHQRTHAYRRTLLRHGGKGMSKVLRSSIPAIAFAIILPLAAQEQTEAPRPLRVT